LETTVAISPRRVHEYFDLGTAREAQIKLTRTNTPADVDDETDLEPQTVEDVLALLEVRPDDADLYQLLGSLHFRNRDLAAANKAYRQACRLDPEDPFKCLFLGNLLAINEDKREAMAWFERAEELAPRLWTVYWCKGNLYREQRKYNRADQAYRRAVELEPEDECAQRTLAEWIEFAARQRRPCGLS
jgi:Flp pilus assembly protein TadD